MNLVVVDVATRVRGWTERFAKRSYFPRDLAGACAWGSAVLHHHLQRVGVSSKIAYNDGHCFVLVNSHIVDVTATQFVRQQNHDMYMSQDGVLIVRAAEWKKYCDSRRVYAGEYWEHERVFVSVDSLIKHLMLMGWPSEQTPRLSKVLDSRI